MSTTEPLALPLSLGRQMYEARKRTGLNQTALAKRWGLHRSTIGRYENDEIDGLLFKHLVDLSNLSQWPLELFARALEPLDGGPDTPPGQVIDASGWFGRTAADSPRLARSA